MHYQFNSIPETNWSIKYLFVYTFLVMGSASQQKQKPPLLFSLHELVNEAEGNSHFIGDGGKQTSSVAARRSRVMLMKSSWRAGGRIDRGGRRRLGRSTGNRNLQIARRVRILKKLVPSRRERESESEPEPESGLDNLFRETADYILALQLRVKVMQVMVDVLSSSSTGSD